MNHREKIVTLSALPGVGARMIYHAFEFFGGFQQPSLEDLLHFIQILQKDPVKKQDLEHALRKKDRIMDLCEHHGIQPICMGEEAYPKRFGPLELRPAVLYVRGEERLLTADESVAVIGTRKPSQEGRERAYRFAQRAGEGGMLVVSGLAVGCDTYAHLGALESVGKTMALLPSGLLSLYPPSNEDLAASIVQKGGALVSEYDPDEKPQPYKFVARDRLQVLLSRKVLVVETDIVGGTMHTVNFAKEHGREIGVVGYPNMDGNTRRGNRILMVHPDYRTRSIENDGDLDRYLHEKG